MRIALRVDFVEMVPTVRSAKEIVVELRPEDTLHEVLRKVFEDMRAANEIPANCIPEAHLHTVENVVSPIPSQGMRVQSDPKDPKPVTPVPWAGFG